MTNLSKTYLRSQSGFSLIEVLISLLVLGVGLLGLGGLQVASLKGTTNAHSRNVASMLVVEIADRMRANPAGVAGSFYDDVVNCTVSERQCRSNNVNIVCSPQEIAHYDIQEVMCGMRVAGNARAGGIVNLLSNGSLQINCNNDCGLPNEPHNVRITWGERNIDERQQGNGLIQTLTIPIIP